MAVDQSAHEPRHACFACQHRWPLGSSPLRCPSFGSTNVGVEADTAIQGETPQDMLLRVARESGSQDRIGFPKEADSQQSTAGSDPRDVNLGAAQTVDSTSKPTEARWWHHVAEIIGWGWVAFVGGAAIYDIATRESTDELSRSVEDTVVANFGLIAFGALFVILGNSAGSTRRAAWQLGGWWIVLWVLFGAYASYGDGSYRWTDPAITLGVLGISLAIACLGIPAIIWGRRGNVVAAGDGIKITRISVNLLGLLLIPLGILNALGGIVSGIWLAILGDWGSIGYELLGMMFSTFCSALSLCLLSCRPHWPSSLKKSPTSWCCSSRF